MEQNKENKERYGIIYKITNTVNGKCYIGQTVNSFNERYSFSGEGIERVYRYHKHRKEHNSHYNVHLLGAIEKYGFEAFIVIEEFDVGYSKEQLDSLECKYIKEFNCIENGYNNNEGGSNGKHSEEACKKMSENHYDCRGENNPMYGKQRTEESRMKQSESRKGKYCGENSHMYGKHLTEDVRRKMSESRKGKFAGENHPMYGKHHTDESRMKQSEAKKGKYIGENNPFYGRTHSEETKKKIQEARKGRTPSAKKIICLNDGAIFDSIKECAEYYKKDIKTIGRVCKHEQEQTKDGLRFMYYDEYLQQQEQQDRAVI